MQVNSFNTSKNQDISFNARFKKAELKQLYTYFDINLRHSENVSKSLINNLKADVELDQVTFANKVSPKSLVELFIECVKHNSKTAKQVISSSMLDRVRYLRYPNIPVSCRPSNQKATDKFLNQIDTVLENKDLADIYRKNLDKNSILDEISKMWDSIRSDGIYSKKADITRNKISEMEMNYLTQKDQQISNELDKYVGINL